VTAALKLAGKVAVITGAGRGQGRQHAIRLAQEGVDIIAIDVCQDYESTSYSMSTQEDLNCTARLVEQCGRRVVAVQADVRDAGALKEGVDAGVSTLGRLDIVCANAGICIAHRWNEVSPSAWNDVIETNLTGVWNTVTVAAPHLITAGGGSVICISSTAGLKGLPFLAPYVAAKHGVVGLVRALANELSQHSIRVNSIHPSHVETPMAEAMQHELFPLIDQHPELSSIFTQALPMTSIVADDISNAVVFLASDDARFITGMTMPIDAGSLVR
jgi:SDR family mycofactocin-dependent oxidoreductase